MAYDLTAAAPPKQDIRRRFDQIEHPEPIDSWTKSKRTKRVTYEGTEEEQLATCLVLLASGSPPSSTTTPNISDKKPVIKKTESSIVAPPKNHNHKCSVCEKVFKSYHALGGHKASHSGKLPNTTTAAAVVAKLKNHTSALSALNPSGRLHTCSICQLSFSSGQALGGHKRKHYEGVINSAKSRTTSSEGGRGDKSGITSEVGGASQLTVAVPRNFDLNMPPSPEFYCEEEVESALPPLFK